MQSASNDDRVPVLDELESGELGIAEAARRLGLSIRQLQRLRASYHQEGAAALVHGNRGRRPRHALDPSIAGRIVQLASTAYAGCTEHEVAALLAKRDGVLVSRSTVHRALKAAGLVGAGRHGLRSASRPMEPT
jgi:transposase